MKSTLRIGLLVKGSSTFGRDIMRGALFFSQAEPSVWVFMAEDTKALDKADIGCLVQSSARHDRFFASRGKTCGLNVSHVGWESHFPRLINDDEAVGRMAADHFLERGFQRFLYIGNSAFAYSCARAKGFRGRIEERLGSAKGPVRSISYYEFLAITPEELPGVLGPAPVGCFCASDAIASGALCHLRESPLHIPDQVAVLGVDNDELENMRAPIPISSIRLNGTRIGYRGAETLFRMMTESYKPPPITRISPMGVEIRASTDVIAHEDPMIRDILQYIARHYADAIQVEDIVRLTGMARRTLEKKFKERCGDTLLQRIHAVRMDRAKQLLVFTPHTVEQIAGKTGFGESRQMIAAFKQHIGITPGAYRRQYGQGLVQT